AVDGHRRPYRRGLPPAPAAVAAGAGAHRARAHRTGRCRRTRLSGVRSTRVLHAVDSHTEGMPTRVITGGVGALPGATMDERRQWFLANRDDLRTMLMYEPRGHASMSGAILQPATRDDADYGVLYIEV